MEDQEAERLDTPGKLNNGRFQLTPPPRNEKNEDAGLLYLLDLVINCLSALSICLAVDWLLGMG
jgi:hypothetical protein